MQPWKQLGLVTADLLPGRVGEGHAPSWRGHWGSRGGFEPENGGA